MAPLAGLGQGERLAQVPVAGILGRDCQALPLGERVDERVVAGSQVFNPLAHLRDRLSRGQGELVTLVLGGGLGFGRAQRRVVLAGVTAAEFGVGGHGQVALPAGGGIPVISVGHYGGEHGFALLVGVMQGVVAVGELLLPGGGVVLAAAAGGFGFGAGAEGGQAGVPGGGADLAELVTDVSWGPGRFDGVGVAQVQQPAVGRAADVRPIGRAEGGEGLVPGGPHVGGGRGGFGPDGLGVVVVAGEFPPGADGGGPLLPAQPVQRIAGPGQGQRPPRAGRGRRRAHRCGPCGRPSARRSARRSRGGRGRRCRGAARTTARPGTGSGCRAGTGSGRR